MTLPTKQITNRYLLLWFSIEKGNRMGRVLNYLVYEERPKGHFRLLTRLRSPWVCCTHDNVTVTETQDPYFRTTLSTQTMVKGIFTKSVVWGSRLQFWRS